MSWHRPLSPASSSDRRGTFGGRDPSRIFSAALQMTSYIPASPPLLEGASTPISTVLLLITLPAMKPWVYFSVHMSERKELDREQLVPSLACVYTGVHVHVLVYRCICRSACAFSHMQGELGWGDWHL